MIIPVTIPVSSGFPATDEYVRRFWVAAIGAGPVEELLRLAAAASRRQKIRKPVFLSTLVSEGLAVVAGDMVAVPEPIPLLGSRARGRLTPSMRSEHARFIEVGRATSATG